MWTKETLRAKRKELGLTQRQLADMLNVSSITISNWERGAYAIPAALRMPDTPGGPVIVGKVCAATHPRFYTGTPRQGYERNESHPRPGPPGSTDVYYDTKGRFWLRDGTEVFSDRAPTIVPTPMVAALEQAESTGDFDATFKLMAKKFQK